MALNEKELEKIKNRFEKQNEIILNLYQKTGNKEVLDLLYLKSDDIAQVSKEFGISEELATQLIQKNKQFSEKNSENLEGNSADFSEDNSDFEDFADSDDFADENSDDEKTADKTDDFSSGEDFEFFKSSFPEKVIEALCFFGDVIQDTSEKICDALDESIERVNNFDFVD